MRKFSVVLVYTPSFKEITGSDVLLGSGLWKLELQKFSYAILFHIFIRLAERAKFCHI